MSSIQQKLGILLTTVIAASVAATVPVSASRTSSVEGDKPLTVCRDAEGNTKTGALDVLLLLDNSKSLNSTRNNRIPSDPKNERYGAIAEMLKSLGEVSGGVDGRNGVSINFGVISFGDNARTALELEPLTSGNSQEIGKRVEEKVPGKVESQSSATNYITALESAVKTLNDRPSENCKFLVWFTDGQFESNETKKPEEQREQAEWLQSKVCGKGGFADQFIEARINTFVLVLKPTKTDRRLAVSYGTMQAITGATDLPPEVQSGIGKSAGMCGNLASSPRLGDILIASDAKEIARKIPTIANLLTNWVPVTQCPARSDAQGLDAMPAARHTKGLSFTAYEKGRELADLSSAEIIDNAGDSHPFEDYLTKDSGSRFEQKYVMNERAVSELNQGWSIGIKNGPAGWCVQMIEHKFEVSFQGAQPVVTSKGGTLTENDLRDLTYFDKSNKDVAITLTEAVSFTGEVGAALVIDPTKVIYAKPIDIRVKQQDRPDIQCESFVLNEVANIPSPARIEAPCIVDTEQTKVQEVKVALVTDPSLTDEECNAVLGLVAKPIDKDFDKKDAITNEVTLKQGTSRVFLFLEAQGNEANCQSDKAIVKFTWEVSGKGTQVDERKVDIALEWKAKPSSLLVWAIVIASLLIAAFLNLLLLREIKKFTSKMARNGLFAFEVPVQIIRQRTGQLLVKTREGADLSSVLFSVEDQFAVRVESDQRHAKFTGGSRSSMRVKLPSLFKPFAAPLLVLDSKKSVYYAPNFEGGLGLSPLARQAVIIHSPVADGETCDAIVSLLLPNTAMGKEQMVRDLLGSRLANAMKPAANDPDWFGSSVVQPGGGNPQSDAASPISPNDSSSSPSGNDGLRPPRPGMNN
jgi:hypothetical protein